MDQQPICKECKYSMYGPAGNAAGYTCQKAIQKDPNRDRVTGKRTPKWEDYCEYQRAAPWPIHYLFGICGTAGRWFEPEDKS